MLFSSDSIYISPSKISLDRKCYVCPSFLLFEELVQEPTPDPDLG